MGWSGAGSCIGWGMLPGTSVEGVGGCEGLGICMVGISSRGDALTVTGAVTWRCELRSRFTHGVAGWAHVTSPAGPDCPPPHP